jgi:acyl-CoA-dependent ceramide synthase
MNYVDCPIIAPFFFIFMCVWAYLRHYINLKILWSILTEFATVGDFTLNWETQQYKCWISQYITFALLAALQAVNLVWWFYICRIAYRMVFLNIVEDERSEDEGEEDELETEEKKEARKEAREARKEAKKANGVVKGANGTATGAATNGTPKLLINGQEPILEERNVNLDPNGSIASRLRERRSKS